MLTEPADRGAFRPSEPPRPGPPLLVLALLTLACPGEEDDSGAMVDTGMTNAPTSSTDDPTGTSNPTSTSNPTGTSNPTLDTGDSDTTGETGETTGPPVTCGDGQVQPPEACDDANQVDADGCNSDCTISGSILFEHSQAAGLGGTDQAFGVAVDAEGNAYLVGELGQATNDAWVRQYTDDDGLGFTLVSDNGGDDGARAVATRGGQFYVAGHSSNNLTLIEYDTDGNQGWSVNYNGQASGSDVGHAVATDPMGNVIVAGHHRVFYFDGVSNLPHDNVFVRKYSAAGAEAWTVNYGGPINTGEDRAQGVATDAAGNVIVTGWESVSGAGRDIWVRKFDPASGVLWTQTYSGAEMDDDQALGVAVGPDDSIVVVGLETQGGLPILWMRKFDPDGNELWTETWAGDTGEGAEARGVGIDDAGDISITGQVVNAGVGDMFVRKYDPSGVVRWTTLLPSNGGADGLGRDITIAPNQRIWVAGSRDLGVDGQDIYVARLAQ